MGCRFNDWTSEFDNGDDEDLTDEELKDYFEILFAQGFARGLFGVMEEREDGSITIAAPVTGKDDWGKRSR